MYRVEIAILTIKKIATNRKNQLYRFDYGSM